MERPKSLKDMIEYLEYLENSDRLLKKIWNDLGPYGNGYIASKTMSELQSQMKFDDSE